jgi:pantothenate kinase
MNYRIIYTTEPERIIAATIMDARNTIAAIKGKSGQVAKDYVDSQINLVPKIGGLVYKVVTFNENMVGYLVLSVDNITGFVDKIQQVIRPNYQSLESEVNQVVTNFINTGGWKADFLV